MLAPGARVVAAVSGGADSVALLHALMELAPLAGATVAGIAHFNHKQRGAASDADEGSVAGLAARHHLAFYRAEPASPLEGNLEQAMRIARREFFAGLIGSGAATSVALGHTRDDQAETVLFRVLRGAGLNGLAGIHPVTAEGLIRPLLDVTRVEVEEFLRVRGIEWREDASNRDLRFARNRIRHQLLPQLARDWNPKIVDALAHLGDLAWEENRLWDSPTEAGVEVDAHALAAMPRARARRMIRGAIAAAKGDLRSIEFAHVERVLGAGWTSLGQRTTAAPRRRGAPVV